MSNIQQSINSNLFKLSNSATLAINEKSAELENQGKEIFRFGFGQSPFPVPESVVNSLKEYAYEKSYLPIQGLKQLREEVAGFYNRIYSLNINSENIIIGPGSKILMYILQTVYNSELIVPTPHWVSYIPQAIIANQNYAQIHTKFENKWKLTSDELETFLKTTDLKPRLLLLNYPANPDGVTYASEQLKGLAEVCRQYGIVVLSDEIYDLTNYEGKHQSIFSYYPEGTIISSGLSKWCGAGGWRLGTFVIPEKLDWLKESMLKVISETYTSVSSPVQYAAITAYKVNKEINNYLINSRKILKLLSQNLTDILLDSGIKVHYPDGGFYIFPDFEVYRDKLSKKGISNSVELCEKLLAQAGVATLPGFSFGRKLSELTLRLAFVNFDGKKALGDIQNHNLLIDENFISKYCKNTISGVKKIIDWLNN